MRKNTTGQYVAFQAISKTDGSDVTTGTPVVYYTIDGGTQAQTTATAVHEGNGQWSVALSQAETNGDHIVFSFVLSGAVSQTVNVYTIDADLTNLDAAVSSRSTLSQADVRSAVGLASANLDTQLADIPTVSEFEARTLIAASYFDPTSDTVTTDAASRTASQADVSALATSAEIAALNDPSADAVADAVWDEALSGHNVAGSTGKALRQIKEGVITTESSVNDSSATATTFVTALTEAVDGFFHDKTMVFISGSLSGQARHIETYVGATKSITVSQPFTSAPADGDEFLILATHEHSLDEIADSVWDEAQSGHTTGGTFGYYVDARISQVASGGSSPWDSLLSDYATPGTFGARFQEAARYTNTDANIIYVTRGDSYDGTANAQLSFAVTKDYSGWTGTMTVRHRVTDAVLLTASVTVESATELRVSLSTSDTAFALLTTDADFGPHPYDIEMVSGASEQSAIQGVMVIRKDQTTA